MSIERIEINDFLAFKGEFAADFCPGVNVFIGGNGCGKTTIMKCLYATSEWSLDPQKPYFLFPYFSSEQYKKVLPIIPSLPIVVGMSPYTPREMIASTDYQYSFCCVEKRLGERRTTPYITIHCSNDSSVTYCGECSYTDKLNDLSWKSRWKDEPLQSVFIPEKDLHSNSRGLPETVEYGKASFTQIEVDIIKKARVLATSEEKPLYRQICDLIKGEPENDGQNFFIVRDGVKIPYSMEASGFRKFGLLATLIRNEQIKPGSVLFWDEPENSLNPELMPKLVEILLELSRSGVQIFLATHSYDLARYFDVRKDKTIPVAFHNLVKENAKIICNTAPEYIELENNLMETASANLFDAVTADAMGVDIDEA
jgi:hypothetical protein